MYSAVVTGAGGFIGQAVVQELKLRGVEVIPVVHSAYQGNAIACELTQYQELPSIINEKHPEVFYHFAWSGTSGELRADVDVQLMNIRGTCAAVKAAAAMGCRRFVFAASIMGYEVLKDINDTGRAGKNAVYSTAKLSADFMARILSAELGIEYCSGLISNVYGPREYSQRLINTSIRKLLAGEHLSLTSCDQMYDFIYITDAAKAFVEIGDKGIDGSTYYIGSTNPQKLRIFMEKLRDVVAPGVELGFGEIPFNGVGLTYKEFTIDQVWKDTGFRPEIDFSEGIARTRDWIKEHLI